MKKIIALVLCLFILLLCGCSKKDTYEPAQEYKYKQVEQIDNLTITYIYDPAEQHILSRNIYNKETGITTEYTYYYKEDGWGSHLIDSDVRTIDKDGNIISSTEVT